MAFSFNVIACMLPFLSGAELESAGVLMARVITDAIRCSTCGAHYSLIVPLSTSGLQLEVARKELLSQIHGTCGNHPLLIQKQ